MADLDLTQGQRDGLLAAGIIRSWGTALGAHGSYVLAPGMTWEDVYAVTGRPVEAPVMDHDGWQDDEQAALGVFPNGRPGEYLGQSQTREED